MRRQIWLGVMKLLNETKPYENSYQDTNISHIVVEPEPEITITKPSAAPEGGTGDIHNTGDIQNIKKREVEEPHTPEPKRTRGIRTERHHPQGNL